MPAVLRPGLRALGWTVAVQKAGCGAVPLPSLLFSAHWGGGWCRRRQRLVFSGAVMKTLGQVCPFSLWEESLVLCPSH